MHIHMNYFDSEWGTPVKVTLGDNNGDLIIKYISANPYFG